jgi:hypothetical protein
LAHLYTPTRLPSLAPAQRSSYPGLGPMDQAAFKTLIAAGGAAGISEAEQAERAAARKAAARARFERKQQVLEKQAQSRSGADAGGYRDRAAERRKVEDGPTAEGEQGTDRDVGTVGGGRGGLGYGGRTPGPGAAAGGGGGGGWYGDLALDTNATVRAATKARESAAADVDADAVTAAAEAAAAAAHRAKIQASKYLGGDEARTHLVKGLDFALLARVR